MLAGVAVATSMVESILFAFQHYPMCGRSTNTGHCGERIEMAGTEFFLGSNIFEMIGAGAACNPVATGYGQICSNGSPFRNGNYFHR